MATITTDTFLDTGTARTPGEIWVLNGGRLTVRTDTRWHIGAPASMTGSLGSITVSPTLGGGLLFDATDVRWMAYNTGAGTVPAIGTIVTQGGISGYLLGVWADLVTAPQAVGSAMPVSGFIKFREVTGGVFSVGPLAGITANVASPDEPGWIEVVMDQAAGITLSRNGSGHVTRGDWFYLSNTTGAIGQVLQVPTNGGGVGTYCPGAWIETAENSNTYTFWPALSSTLSNGWAVAHLGAPRGMTDVRQSFVKGLGSGQMQIGESLTQASTYASVSQASTYTWANNLVTVTFTAHGLSIGEQVYLDFTTGGATADGVFTVEQVLSANAYTVVLSGAGTGGNVTAVSRTTVTFTANTLSVGQQVMCATTSGTLPSGMYEIMQVVDANNYRINTPIPPGATGNVNINMTIGHIPPANCRVRIPNIIGRQCVTTARSVNARPNATLGTRPDYVTSGAGSIDHEYFYHDWYYSLVQPYAVRLHHVATFDSMSISECATGLDMVDGGFGMDQSLDIAVLVLTSNFAGGVIAHWKFHRGNVPGAGDHAVTVSQCVGQQFSDCEFGIIQTPRSSGQSVSVGTSVNLIFNRCRQINAPLVLTTCSDIKVTDFDHVDRLIGVSNLVSSIFSFLTLGACARITINGVTEGYNGLIPRVHAASGILNAASCNFVTLRNVGTRSNPLGSLNGVSQRGAVYTSGGNNTNIRIQRCYVSMIRNALIADTNSDKDVLYESVSAPYSSSFLPYTLTIAALNATVRGVKAPLTWLGGNASVYGTRIYDQFTSWFRMLSTYTLVTEIVTVTGPAHDLVTGSLVYLEFTSGSATTRSGVYTVAGVLNATVFTVVVPGGATTSGNVIAYRSMVTQPDDLFTHQGMITLPMNEATAETAPFVQLTGLPRFTSVPGAIFPTNSEEIVFETQYFIRGHTGFLDVPVTLTGTSLLNQASGTYTWASNLLTVTLNTHNLRIGDVVFFDVDSGLVNGLYTVDQVIDVNRFTVLYPGSGAPGNLRAFLGFTIRYQLDTGSGYGPLKNLSRRSFGGRATGGVPQIVVGNTSGVAVGDHAYGVGIPGGARVISIDSPTSLTLSVNPRVSNVLQFVDFNALPSETITPTGFRMKISIQAQTPGSRMSIGYLSIPTTTTPLAQDFLYPLDTATMVFTGLPLNTDIVVLGAGTNTILAQQDSNPSASYAFTYEGTPVVDVGFIKTGYVPLYVRNLALTASNSTIPVAMTVDRNFI